MKTDRSPELSLLLMAGTGELSADKTARLTLYLQQQTPDWNRLLELADRHRLTPLLYHALRHIPAVPDSFLSTLHRECQAIAMDTLLKLHEYKRVAALLAEHHIEHLAFKGIYLAEHSYPECSLRPVGDMDILVAENDLYKAARVLAPDGYQLCDKHHPYLQQPEGVMLDELHEISLFKPFYATSRFDIDLQWRVEFLLKEIGSLQLSDVLQPADRPVENQIILLVLHHGVNNVWERIGYLNDLYFLLRSTDIDWPWLLEKLKRYRLEIVFFVGLHWCQLLWDYPVPPPVQALMPVDKLRLLARNNEAKWESQPSYLLRHMVFDFANAQPLLTDKLTIYREYSRNYIFRASSFSIKNRQFHIPKQWGFTTVLIRALWALRLRR